MKNLEKLFESLDEKIFTTELKQDLTEQFELAVAEASKVSEANLTEKVEALAEVKAIEIVAEKVEEKISELEEKAEEFQAVLVTESKEKESELLEQVDQYLEKVVDDFISEAKDSLEESVKAEKSDMIIEAMDAMLVATGTDIAKIVEAKDSTDAESQLAESIEKYDALIEENIMLAKEKATMMKLGLIAEMKEGLNVIESEKFAMLADLVEYTQTSEYVTKLETIKENIGSSKSEDKIEEKLVEKVEVEVSESLATSFSHLV